MGSGTAGQEMHNQLHIGIFELIDWVTESIFFFSFSTPVAFTVHSLSVAFAEMLKNKLQRFTRLRQDVYIAFRPYEFFSEEQLYIFLLFFFFSRLYTVRNSLALPALGGQIKSKMIHQLDSSRPVSVAATAAAASTRRQLTISGRSHMAPIQCGHDTSRSIRCD